MDNQTQQGNQRQASTRMLLRYPDSQIFGDCPGSERSRAEVTL